MRSVIRYVTAAMAALMIALGIGATVTANAAPGYTPQLQYGKGCNTAYISADGVRLRQKPGGTIMGHARKGQKVYLLTEQVGQWKYVSIPIGADDGTGYQNRWVSSLFIGCKA